MSEGPSEGGEGSWLEQGGRGDTLERGHSVRERLRGLAGAQGRNLKPIYGIGKRLPLWALSRMEAGICRQEDHTPGLHRARQMGGVSLEVVRILTS